MLEFTGERVVPGLADPNLFNEHRARYRFAARFARRFGAQAAVLDAGCGTGYGIAEFTSAASVTAFDVSFEAIREAIREARDNFSGPGVRLLQAACESLPFADGSFDLVVAFEVIEHLERWPEMLSEAKRVLKPAGVLLVSTPNKAYYAESRGAAGPNPFHVREFEYGEFSSALEAAFPHVRLWTQNHLEAHGFLPAFLPPSPSAGVLDVPDEHDPENAHFFFAACSRLPVACAEAFAWLPASGNILRERERHIALLNSELEQKTAWLEQMEAEHSSLNRAHEGVLAELAEHNAWAARLDEELRKSREHIAAMERQTEERLAWIHDLESQIAGGIEEIERLNGENTGLRVAFEERTQWGESVASELERVTREIARLEAEVAVIDHSKWMRLGRALRLGPEVRGSR